MTNDNITTIILAGGRSSRMGRDKALLPVNGVPLLQRVCEVAIALCDRVYVVTPWQERYQHLLPVGCEFVREVMRESGDERDKGDKGEQRSRGAEEQRSRGAEEQRSRGAEEQRSRGAEEQRSREAATNYQLPTTNSPLVGFAQGLIHVETEWVLLLACDLPCLRLEVLQDWAWELEEMPQEAIALLPRHSKGWEPLCGFYRRSCIHTLEEYIDRGGRSFQQWLSRYPVRSLSDFEPSMLFNCNTPADYAAVSQEN